ncbi:hypothetical protein [Crateriforma conspicua]|uniref:hypothetical protein n=1 Tax=Crateriforma conspicua TaxID=2527996 RepID=UPI001188EE0F|nr:hypothetical protein [Crateriforma conspicua]QDV62038.1 hypothetical protein Mal65_11660 [Crateriforma conspicua]
MEITSVSDVLSELGIEHPDLNVLAPTQSNYSALLFQPQGNIELGQDGVRHADSALANDQFSAFLNEAVRSSADLVVSPEYSMPWRTLEVQLSNGVAPVEGSVWVLGCESITISELTAMRGRLSHLIEFVFEEIDNTSGRFLNPVAYIFRSKRHGSESSDQLVMLLQFKICPLGDPDHFEVNGLQTGSRLYCFGNGTSQLRMATLICSDAFAFLDEHAKLLYDRTLLIHIQLNAKPRQDQFRRYRSSLLQYGGGQTELVCLNWAQNVHASHDGSEKCWSNIGGSAWYLCPDKFDNRDSTLAENHRRGLYYTWLESLRSHALFFNYSPSLFLLNATKVAHIGVPASLSRRRGPQVVETRAWEPDTASWVVQDSVDDGFAAIAVECGGAETKITAMASTNPFQVERLLALCAGKVEKGANWHTLKELDSCAIESTEVVRRITACQDGEAHHFRVERLRRCKRLYRLLEQSLPAGIADLEAGFDLDWHPDSPHQNVVSKNGRRATAIYLGDDYSETQVESIVKTVEEYLGQSLNDPDDIIEARQRLQVWYRSDEGNDVTFDSHPYVDIDDPKSGSPFDITRPK